jgi:ABC-2 type transport system permease protein
VRTVDAVSTFADSPFVYLTLCSMRNRALIRLRRLREARYLIGLIIGTAYFAFIFGRYFMIPARSRPGIAGDFRHSETVVVMTALGLLVFAAVAWLWPGRRPPALGFRQADVQFLFTAPITRRRLVRYQLIRSQLASLFGSAVITLFMRPGSIAEAGRLWVGVVLTMAIVNLHLTGISLSTAASAGAVVRRWLPRGVVVIAVLTVGLDVAARWPDAGANVISDLTGLLAGGLSRIVLWPLVRLARLPLADSPAAFAAALPWALLIVGLNYVWVLGADVPFEEGSAELSEKLARARTEGIQALRTPRTVATPFRLQSEGRIEFALLWKNLISMGRFLSWVTLVRFCFPIIVFVALASRGGRNAARADALATVALMAAVITTWAGPQIARADLRQDLAQLAVLRTWPLRGATLVRGEVLAPFVVLVSLAWMALVIASIASTGASFQVPGRWSWLAAGMTVVPGLILMQLLVQNAAAVAFPSWVAIGRSRGVEVIGQRMLLMVASILAVGVAIVPAAIVGAVVFLVVRSVNGGIPIVMPAVGAGAVLLAEALACTELIGVMLDRTDVTALDPSDT